MEWKSVKPGTRLRYTPPGGGRWFGIVGTVIRKDRSGGMWIKYEGVHRDTFIGEAKYLMEHGWYEKE